MNVPRDVEAVARALDAYHNPYTLNAQRWTLYIIDASIAIRALHVYSEKARKPCSCLFCANERANGAA